MGEISPTYNRGTITYMPIYGLSYHKLAQTSYFQADKEFARGDRAVIGMDQGQTLGRVVSGPHADLENLEEDSLPHVVRRATEADLEQEKANEVLAGRARNFWQDCVNRRHLDMKLVDVEVFLDRSKFIFYFTAPARIDFRELVKDLVHEYRVRIELRQIGVRHETQMIGAVGNCGMVCCCRRYLRQFAPVTIRMAKEQNLFLNPTKVSGICGRLLCCLAYEQESYDAFHRDSPRLGKRYQTSRGPLRVIRTNMFCNDVTCLTDQNEEVKFSLEEWKALGPTRPEQPPCSQGQAGQPAKPQQPQHDLMVLQATEESVTDPDFFDDYFPPGMENEAQGPAIPDGPVMEPGEDEARPRKKHHRHPVRGRMVTGRRGSSLHPGEQTASPDPAAGGGIPFREGTRPEMSQPKGGRRRDRQDGEKHPQGDRTENSEKQDASSASANIQASRENGD